MTDGITCKLSRTSLKNFILFLHELKSSDSVYSLWGNEHDVMEEGHQARKLYGLKLLR